MKKDMEQCPQWILNSLKSTSEKSKSYEKQYIDTKNKLEKLVESTQQWKSKMEKELGEKDKEINELKEKLKKEQQQKQKLIDFLKQQPNYKSQIISENITFDRNSRRSEEQIDIVHNEINSTNSPIISNNDLSHANEEPKEVEIHLDSHIITKLSEESIKISYIKAGLDELSKALLFGSVMAHEEYSKIFLSSIREAIKLKNFERMIPSFIKIFNHKGSSLSVIHHFIEDEIKNSQSLGTLFRGNSLASKLLKDYIPTISKDYLSQILLDFIKKIVSENKSMEIDPLKEENKVINVEENLKDLCKVTDELLTRIVDSAPNFPLPLRSICNCLSSAVSLKYGEEQKALGVGALIFLRVFCPVITAPWFFGLFNDISEVPETSRRTLVLISKILTNIANQQIVGENSQKEPFMKSTDQFVSENMEKSIKFLLGLTVLPTKKIEAEKILMNSSQCLEHYKLISTEMINAGRDKLVSNLELLKNPSTNKPYLFSYLLTVPIFQLFFPFLKQMGIPEKGRKYIINNKSPTSKFINMLFENEMKISQELVAAIKKTPKSFDTQKFIGSIYYLCFYYSFNKYDLCYQFPILYYEKILLHDLSFSASYSDFASPKLFKQAAMQIGKKFLKSSVANMILEMVETNPYLEYDQCKLPPELSASENIQQLISITKTMVEKVLSKMEEFPTFLHNLLYIYKVESQSNRISKTLQGKLPDVSNLLFDHFICEAIENPYAYGCVDLVPRKEAQRSLEIVSELLKNISAKKKVTAESDVTDLNIFLKENSGPISQYLNSWIENSPPNYSSWKNDFHLDENLLNESIFELHQNSIILQSIVSNKITVVRQIVLTPAEAISATITHSYKI
eukprot:TRINITY_DN6247_c0_g2_i1.p1 TRINITY_DN6247_c0_g2~~TRINITY_DN6247_c0_g2_i1.p1  ORF type:complete len:873 (-),score=246.05 TRINITY_DN6247_c0_g2_i1:33-2591(-)